MTTTDQWQSVSCFSEGASKHLNAAFEALVDKAKEDIVIGSPELPLALSYTFDVAETEHPIPPLVIEAAYVGDPDYPAHVVTVTVTPPTWSVHTYSAMLSDSDIEWSQRAHNSPVLGTANAETLVKVLNHAIAEVVPALNEAARKDYEAAWQARQKEVYGE